MSAAGQLERPTAPLKGGPDGDGEGEGDGEGTAEGEAAAGVGVLCADGLFDAAHAASTKTRAAGAAIFTWPLRVAPG